MKLSTFSERVATQAATGITPFDMKVMTRKLEDQGKHIIHLEIGEPDFDTPQHIKEAGIRAILDGHTHYAPSQGLPELRTAIADYISSTRKIQVSPGQVVVVPGAKDIIFFTMMALLTEGDEVIVPDPGYYPYNTNAKLFGGVPVPVPLREQQDFTFEIDSFLDRISPKTKLIVVGSPHNPTGSVIARSDLETIARIALEKDIYLISDEIYSHIIYDEPFASIASLPGLADRTIILEGFSKTYAMTGWRLGYSVTNEKLAKIFNKFMVASNSCVATFVQMAGIEALQGSQECVEEMRQEYQERRDLVVNGLTSIKGVTCRRPKGAFYAFPNIKAFGQSSDAMTTYLLNEAHVAVIPGTTFGSQGEGYLRISYANSRENLAEGLRRIKIALEKLTP